MKKESILDTKVQTNLGERIDIEMQMCIETDRRERRIDDHCWINQEFIEKGGFL